MATFREKAFSLSRFGFKNGISAQIAPVPVYCLLFDFVCFASVFLHLNEHYLNASVLIKFSQKISVFTLNIVSPP